MIDSSKSFIVETLDQPLLRETRRRQILDITDSSYDPRIHGRNEKEKKVVRSSPSEWFVQATRKRLRKFTVVEVSNGRLRRNEMQTPELLRYVHFHNKLNKLEDMEVGALKLRDLRQVVSPHGVDRPSIEARRNCILVNLLSIRCIIQHNRALFIQPVYGESRLNESTDGCELLPLGPVSLAGGNIVEDENYVLVEKMKHLSEIQSAGPFEFVALEAILVEVCRKLMNELLPLKRRAEQLLIHIGKDPNSSKRLHEVTDLRRHLDVATDKVSGVHTALRELLDTDEDIHRLHITRFWSNPEEWAAPVNTTDSEDVEILLECYEQEVESMLKSINRTDASLDDALQMVELHLASVRNTFLKSELGLDIVGVVIAFVGAIAGLFGMNIKSGLEEDDHLFWILTYALLFSCGIASLLTFYVFSRMKL